MNQAKILQIYNALEDKKAQRITILDIEKISFVADNFIIASGSNRSQVQALADNVQESMAKSGHPCKSVDGYRSANWILLDYYDVVVHIFDNDTRLFYDLERLWSDATVVNLEK